MLVNGKRQTSIALDSRGLAYGDGLFETIRLHNHRPVLWDLHLERLRHGCDVLGLADCEQLLLNDLITLQPDFPSSGVLKIILSRSAGGRGYRGTVDEPAERIITLHPLPPDQGEFDGIHIFISPVRLALQPLLAGLKHLNRLEQVMASKHWPSTDCHETLMLDQLGRLVEGSRSNLFLSLDGTLVTPSLEDSGVKGVLRESLLRAWPQTECRELSMSDLLAAEELFFCNSVVGVWPVSQLSADMSDGLLTQDLHWPVGPFARRAMAHFHEKLSSP